MGTSNFTFPKFLSFKILGKILRTTRELFYLCVPDLILIFLSYIVPKDPKLYVFISFGGRAFQGNPKYLYLYFKAKELKARVITTSKILYRQLRDEGVEIVYRKSLDGFITVIRAKYIFIDHSTALGISLSEIGGFLGRFDIIQTWHGVGVKKIELLDSKRNLFRRILSYLGSKSYKIILASSEQIKMKFAHSFNVEPSKVVVTGLPRNDVLFNETLLFKDYKIRLGLERFNRIILFAPTFRDAQLHRPFQETFLKELDHWLDKNNFLFLVKKHPFDVVLKFDSKYKRIWDVSNIVDDVQDLLPYVDVLITDYSSIATDFALTKKPIIFYFYDVSEYINKCRSFYYDPRKVYPGPFAYTQEELLVLLKDTCWFENPEYKKRYDAFAMFYHKYLDGENSRRVDELLETIKNKKS